MNEISAFGVIHKSDNPRVKALNHINDYNGTKQGRKDFHTALKYQRKESSARQKRHTANAGPGSIAGVTAAGALAGGAVGAVTPPGGTDVAERAKLAGAGAALGGAATGGFMLWRKANKKRYQRNMDRYADKADNAQAKYYKGLYAHKSKEYPKGVTPPKQRKPKVYRPV